MTVCEKLKDCVRKRPQYYPNKCVEVLRQNTRNLMIASLRAEIRIQELLSMNEE